MPGRQAFLVTVVGIGAQLTSILLQVFIARWFGAGAALDAFFAGSMLPQYFVTIVVGILPVIFVPMIAAHDTAAVRRSTAAVVIVFSTLATAAALVGIALASPLLRATAPGLPPAVHDLASTVSRITWPGVIALIAGSLLVGSLNVRGAFTWPAATAFVGGLLTVGVAVWLAPRYGVLGVALATTIGAFVPVFLLAPPAFGGIAWRDAWRDSTVREMLRAFWPLALSGILVRSTIIVERYAASLFAQGTIAHVTFASRIIGLVSYVVSVGIATVAFPEIARQIATGSAADTGAQLGRSMRAMWLLVAPAIACGFVLAGPGIAALLQGGRFGATDAAQVTHFIRIYLFSLVGTSLAMVTGRAVYSMRVPNFIAIMGAVEAALYIGYTLLLVKLIGITAVAWGFVVYSSVSLAWQVIFIGSRIGWRQLRTMSAGFARIAACALLAAAAAWIVSRALGSPWPQLLLGSAAALAMYAASLFVIDRGDALILLRRASVQK